MRHITIQIQPERTPALNMADARRVIEALTEDRGIVAGFEVTEGDDKGPYVNFTFLAKEPARLWKRIQKKVLKEPVVGTSISSASIVACEGENGWDDYLLLYHFDPSLELDGADGL